MDLSDLPLWVNIGLLVAAGSATWVAGTRLTAHVEAMASATGAQRTFLGALLLGGITSLPEAATMLTASAVGGGGFAVGNVLGSASANLAILSGSDALLPAGTIMDRARREPVQRQSLLLMALLAIVVAAGAIGSPVHLEVDLWTIAIAVASVAAFLIIRARGSADESAAVVAGAEEIKSERGHHLRRLSAAGAVIVGAGYTAANAGAAIAEQTGLSGSFVGFTLLAISTSLPELSTTVSALRMNRVNLAFGNILGTNIFNHLLLLPADFVDGQGPLFASPDRSVVVGAALAMVLAGLYLVGINTRSRMIGRFGLSSVAVLATYAAGTVVLYVLS